MLHRRQDTKYCSYGLHYKITETIIINNMAIFKHCKTLYSGILMLWKRINIYDFTWLNTSLSMTYGRNLVI